MGELIAELPGGLGRYLPRLSYLLLDEGRVAPEELPAPGNLAGALVRLEQSRELREMRSEVGALVAALRGPQHRELRRSFRAWLEGSFRRAKWPTADIPEAAGLQEDRAMLADKLKIWREEFIEEGRREGRQEGRQQGRQEGRQQGLLEGEQRGLRAGEARVLLRLVEKKFGTVTPEVRERINSASADDLLRWGERLLAAGGLDEVFSD